MFSNGFANNSLPDAFSSLSMTDAMFYKQSLNSPKSMLDSSTRNKSNGINMCINSQNFSVSSNSNNSSGNCNEDRSRTNLIINYLPQSYEQSDLQRLFERIGPIRQCKIIRDKHAVLAIQTYHGYETEQKRLRVAYASSGGRRFTPSQTNANGLSNNLPSHQNAMQLFDMDFQLMDNLSPPGEPQLNSVNSVPPNNSIAWNGVTTKSVPTSSINMSINPNNGVRNLSTNIKKLSIKSPLLFSSHMTNFVNQKGGRAQIYLKLENTQPSSSFKIRGIENALRKYMSENINHVVCICAGLNSAIAAAYCSNAFGMECTLVVPENIEQVTRMNLAIEAPATKVVAHGFSYQECYKKGQSLVQELGVERQGYDTRLLSTLDAPEIMLAYDSIVGEIVQDLGDQPHAIVVPVGSGALLAGIIQGLWNRGMNGTHVITMETEGANCLAQSMKLGHPVSLNRCNSLATSLGCSSICMQAYNQVSCHLTSCFTCTDYEAIDSVHKFLDDHHMLVEPACGAALSAVYNGTVNKMQQENRLPKLAKVVVIVGGGRNVSITQLAEWEQQMSNNVAEHLLDQHQPTVTSVVDSLYAPVTSADTNNNDTSNLLMNNLMPNGIPPHSFNPKCAISLHCRDSGSSKANSPSGSSSPQTSNVGLFSTDPFMTEAHKMMDKDTTMLNDHACFKDINNLLDSNKVPDA